MNQKDESFGFCLKSKRTKAKLTQKALSELCGLSIPIISKIETGYKPPSLNEIKKNL